MKNKNRKKIEKIIDTLEKLGNEYDFRNLETAIVIYLFGEIGFYNDETLQEIDETIWNYDGSILNDDIKNFMDEKTLPF